MKLINWIIILHLILGIQWYVPITPKIPQEDVVPFKANCLKDVDNFQRAWLSVSTLIKDHTAAFFHSEHGVIISNATDFDVRYKNPLILGNLRHEMFQVHTKTSSKASKTYAQIASTTVNSKTQSPAAPVPDLDPKHVAKAGLTLDRLGYPSPERVLILAKEPAY